MPNIPLKLDIRNKKSYGYWVGITPPPPFQTLAQLPTCCIWASKIHLHLFKDGKRISALFNKIFVQWKNEYHEFHSLNRCSLSIIYRLSHGFFWYGILISLRTFCISLKASHKINVSTGLFSAFHYCSASVRSKLVINVNILINN